MRWYCVPAALVLAGALSSILGSQARSDILITVDKAAQEMTVAVDGEVRWTWPVSTGLIKYDTPNGRFGAFRMARKHYSREWDDAPMPYSIFFTHKGHAIHGSYATRRLGRAASHGCVRLAPKNAAQLFALVSKHGLANTLVVVEGTLPGAVPMPVIAVPLPRERSAALRMVAKLETPAAVRDNASAATESKPGTAAVVTSEQKKTAEELTASARTIAQPRESRAALPKTAALDAPRTLRRDASAVARSEAGAAIAVLERSTEELAASARIVTKPFDAHAAQSTESDSDVPAAARRDMSMVAESEPDRAAIATLTPEAPSEGQAVGARLVAERSERRAELRPLAQHDRPVALSEAPTVAQADSGATVIATLSRDVTAAPEQQKESRTIADSPPRQAARALPKPDALPEPPKRPKAEREPPRQRAKRESTPRFAKRTYDDPRTYRRSWTTDRPPAFERRPRFAPHVYYGPPPEIVEEFYVNGHWVRRRYYLQERPRDFYRYR